MYNPQIETFIKVADADSKCNGSYKKLTHEEILKIFEECKQRLDLK